MTSPSTTRKLDRESPVGDSILDEQVMGRVELERLARHLRKINEYADLATDLEVAAERNFHDENLRKLERYGQVDEQHPWPKWPKDPIVYPNSLPAAVFEDERFDPMCARCRDRYKI